MNSFEIVKQMLDKAKNTQKRPKKYYLVFIFCNEKLLKLHIATQDPEEYVLKQEDGKDFQGMEIKYSILEYEEYSEVMEVATNIMLDCKPPFNKRLPDGHNYLNLAKLKQHYYVEDDECVRIFDKHGVDFCGQKWVDNNILLKILPKDAVKLPLHELPLITRLELEDFKRTGMWCTNE